MDGPYIHFILSFLQWPPLHNRKSHPQVHPNCRTTIQQWALASGVYKTPFFWCKRLQAVWTTWEDGRTSSLGSFYAIQKDSCVGSERLHKETVCVPHNEGRRKDLTEFKSYLMSFTDTNMLLFWQKMISGVKLLFIFVFQERLFRDRANSPTLSRSLPDIDWISESVVQLACFTSNNIFRAEKVKLVMSLLFLHDAWLLKKKFTNPLDRNIKHDVLSILPLKQ